MPRPRFHKLPLDKQHDILALATQEFAEHGFDAASYNRIIERAGLSKGAMYYYFDDKADLYGAVLSRLNEDVQEALGAPNLAPDFWLGVRAYYVRMLTFTIEHPEIMAVARSWFRLPPSARGSQSIEGLLEQLRGAVADVLEAGRGCGSVRQDLPVDLLVDITMGVGEVVDAWLLRNLAEEPDLEASVDLLLDVYRRLLEPREVSS